MDRLSPDAFLARLLRHDSFCLTTHVRPDGDAIGSELGLAAFLDKLGKRVTILNSDAAPDNLTWLPGHERIRVWEGGVADHEALVDSEAFVVLDVNNRERVGELAGPSVGARGETFVVDHHTHPETWFDAAFIDDRASSTCELVYRLVAANDPSLIDSDLAQPLYTGLVTDTGSFRFSSVTPGVHRVAADLLERGDLSPDPIHDALYSTRRLAAIRFLARVLDTLTLAHGGQIAHLTIRTKLMQELEVSSDEAEGFVNYALSVEGVKAAVLFLENSRGVKMSFRSRGDVHVNAWAQHFKGGGHRNASGAFVPGKIETVRKRVVASAPRFLELDPERIEADAHPSIAGSNADLLRAMKARMG